MRWNRVFRNLSAKKKLGDVISLSQKLEIRYNKLCKLAKTKKLTQHADLWQNEATILPEAEVHRMVQQPRMLEKTSR